MRIHKLEIQNIASLEGQHQINFDNIFGHSHLFAITGKTGAGKSTILNCISLALYGETYKKQMSSVDYVSIGQDSAQITLFFSTGLNRYKAEWSLRIKNKKGTEFLKKPILNRVLFKQENEEYTAIAGPIESILDLTFEQFCKTTILNQGQFAKFLTSNFNERKEILEKFYEGENISFINSYLKNKIKEHQQQVAGQESLIQGHTDSLDLLEVSSEEIDRLSHTVSEQKNDTLHIKEMADLYSDLLKSSELISTNQTRLEVANSELTKNTEFLNLSAQQIQEHNRRVKKAQDALNTKRPILLQSIEVLREIEMREKSIEQYRQESHTIGLKQKENSHELEKTEKDLVEYQLKSEQLEVYLPQKHTLNDLLDQHKQVDIKLSLYESQCYQRKEAQKKKQILQNELIEVTQGRKELLSKQQELQSLIQESENQKLNELFLDKLKEAMTRNESLSQQDQSYKVQADAVSQKITESHDKEIDLRENAAKETKQLQLLEKNQQLHELTQAIDSCKHQSLEEGHCVICGNPDLTSLKELTQLEENEYEDLLEQISAQREKVTQLNTKLTQLDVELKTYRTQQEKLAEELGKTKLQSKENFALIEDQNITSLAQFKTYIESYSSRLDQLKARRQDLSSLMIKLEAMTNLQTMRKKELEKIERQDSDLSQQLQSFQEEITKIYQTYQLGSKEELDKLLADVKLKESYQLQCIDFEKKMSFLKERIKQYHDDLSSKKVLLEDLYTQNEQARQFLEKYQINDPKKELQQLESEYQQSLTQQKELAKRIKSLEIQQAETKSKISHYTEQLKQINDIIQVQCHSLVKMAKELLLSKNFACPEYQTLQHVLKKLSALTIQDFKETNQHIHTQSYETFTASYTAYLKDYDELVKKLAELKIIQQKKNENLALIKELQTKLAQLKKGFQKFNDLHGLIGKDEFRNFILLTIENILVAQTNQELLRLCQGRYQITQVNKNSRHYSEYEVIDFVMGGKSRKLATLSGGETFLVSLAMALALAELTRGQTQLDTLFIDEGFGTLDSDSIEEVYQLLSEIECRGRQIGIISHIQELTSKIPVNINLQKHQSGHSNLNIILN